MDKYIYVDFRYDTTERLVRYLLWARKSLKMFRVGLEASMVSDGYK